LFLHRIDQLAHEARERLDAGHDHAWNLLGLDLMVDSREGDGELVIGVTTFAKSRYAPHDLWGEMDVYVALGA